MAKVYKKKDRPGPRPWIADYIDSSGKRCRPQFRVKREAEDHLAKVQRELNRGTYVDPRRAEKITVGQLWEQYVEKLETSGARGRGATSPKTLQTYRNHARNHILPRWEDTPLSSVYYEDVEEWANTMTRQNSNEIAGAETRKTVTRLFKAIMDFAVAQGTIARSPALDNSGNAPYTPSKRAIKREHKDPVFLSAAELVALAEQIGPWRDFILFLGSTGLRWGEATAVQVQDLTLHSDAPTVHVHRAYREITGQGLVLGATKTDESRVVGIPGEVVPLLMVRIKGKTATDLVFANRSGGPLRNGNFVKRHLKPAAQAVATENPTMARVSEVTPHDLRHTAISLAIKQGVNIKLVQRMAGHASAVVTMDRYAHLYDDDLQVAAQGVNHLLSAALGVRSANAPSVSAA